MATISRFAFLKRTGSVALAASGAGALARMAHGASPGGPPPTPQFYGIVTGHAGDDLLVRPPHTPSTTPASWTLAATVP